MSTICELCESASSRRDTHVQDRVIKPRFELHSDYTITGSELAATVCGSVRVEDGSLDTQLETLALNASLAFT